MVIKYDISLMFCKLRLTTNVNNNAISKRNSLLHYIYAAGGQLVWQRHSWLSVAFPGILVSTPSKDNHIMPVSKQEQRLYQAIKSVIKTGIKQSFRPTFLQNAKTGNNLEIDIYIPQIKVGFEYQGAVHFQRVEEYRNDHDKARLHDTKKYEILENNLHRKAVIVEIFEPDLTGNIIANVIQRVKNNIAYHYKYRHYGKCEQMQRFLNTVDSEDQVGKRRTKYYELLYYTETCLPQWKKQAYRNVYNFLREFPYVADLSYTGENVPLPFTSEHKEIGEATSGVILKAQEQLRNKEPLRINGAEISVNQAKEVVITTNGESIILSIEDWRSMKEFVKANFKLLNISQAS